MKITGHAAIAVADINGLTLSKYNDEVEESRQGLTSDEARKIASEDPSLIYVEVEMGGWMQRGHAIETPEGINVADYFSAGNYLGADHDGVEPAFWQRECNIQGLATDDERSGRLSVGAHLHARDQVRAPGMGGALMPKSQSIAEQAIDQSIQQNETVWLEPDMDDYEALTAVLVGESDDSVRNGDVMEYWGEDGGESWRIHVRETEVR